MAAIGRINFDRTKCRCSARILLFFFFFTAVQNNYGEILFAVMAENFSELDFGKFCGSQLV